MSVTALQAQSFARRVEWLAADIGCLRRRDRDDEYATHLCDRLALHAEVLDAFLQPSAAEFYAANVWETGDEDESAVAALEDVDARAAMFRRLLGETAARARVSTGAEHLSP